MAEVMMAVSMAMTLAGGGVEAYGAYEGGKRQKEIYDYKKAVALREATYERWLGEYKAGEAGMEERAKGGRIAAGLAAAGLDIRRGSAVEVQESQQALAKMRQQDIRTAAARRAAGQEIQASLYESAGKAAKWEGGVKMVSTLLGAGGRVAGKWYEASSLGATPGASERPIDLGYASVYEKDGGYTTYRG